MLKNLNKSFRCWFVCNKSKKDPIERVFPKTLPPAIGPFTPVTIMGSTVYVSGQIPINP